MHRDDWRIHLLGEAQEAAAPARIAHPAKPEARHSTGRKHDQGLLLGQRLLRRSDRFGGWLAAEDAQRQQQVGQGIERQQQIVRKNLHVAAHAADTVQERQRIDGAERMVGNDHAAPGLGNALAFDMIDQATCIEMLQRGLDETEATQVAVATEEGVDLAEPRPARQRPDQRPRHACAMAFEPARKARRQRVFEIDHALLRRLCRTGTLTRGHVIAIAGGCDRDDGAKTVPCRPRGNRR